MVLVNSTGSQGPRHQHLSALWLTVLSWDEEPHPPPPFSPVLYRTAFTLGLLPPLANTSWEWLLSTDLLGLHPLVLLCRML